MKCPYCGSDNIQPHVIQKDKQARNTAILLLTLLAILGVSAFAKNILLGLLISFPILAILKIVLRLIPAGNITIFICLDCGKKTKLK